MRVLVQGSTVLLVLIAAFAGAARQPDTVLYFEEEGMEPVRVNLHELTVPGPARTTRSGIAADALDVKLTETIESAGNYQLVRHHLTVTARRSVSFLLTQALHFTPEETPVFLSPGVIYNTNNAEISEGNFPQLVYKGPVGTPESSVFHYRADRSGHCSVMAMFDGRIAALAIEEGTMAAGDFRYNGLGIDTSRPHRDTLAIHMGYKNYPARYNGNVSPRVGTRWEEEPDYGWITLQEGETATVESLLYQGPASDTFAYEKPMRIFYEFLREETKTPGDPAVIAQLIADAIIEDAVVEEIGLFRVTDASDECDIGWTGGMMVAGPLLAWGKKASDERSVAAGLRAMDVLVNEGFNPDASLFYDAWRDGEWTVDGWWANWAGGNHLGYTNGQAVFFLLDAWRNLLDPDERDGRELWLERSRAVLETALEHQLPSGEFPASYSPEDGTPGPIEGFGGCWFLPALLKAYLIFEDERYLEAAIHAEEHYFNQLRTLEVWGTPIDAEGAVEVEGNLPLIKGERLLYEITGNERYLRNLEHAINYDFTWKWSYNTHLVNEPLRSMDWLSQGGNGASTCNIHLHPMSNMTLEDLWFLAEKTGDPYYKQRYWDSLDFGMGTINLEDGQFGFGKAGWGTEQFFHTDAMQSQGPPDGGIWYRFLCWSTAAVLHSLVTAPPHGDR